MFSQKTNQWGFKASNQCPETSWKASNQCRLTSWKTSSASTNFEKNDKLEVRLQCFLEKKTSWASKHSNQCPQTSWKTSSASLYFEKKDKLEVSASPFSQKKNQLEVRLHLFLKIKTSWASSIPTSFFKQVGMNSLASMQC